MGSVVELRVLQLNVLLQGSLGAVEPLAVGHFAFELFLNLLGCPSRPFDLILLGVLPLLRVLALLRVLHLLLNKAITTSRALMRLLSPSQRANCRFF